MSQPNQAPPRQFRNYSLRTKIITGFLLISLLSVIAITFFLNRATNAALAANAGGNLKNLAQAEAVATGNLLARQLEALQALSLSRPFRDRLLLANTTYGREPAEIQARLSELDEEWVTTEDEKAFLFRSRLINTVSLELHTFQEAFPDHVEVFLTDQHGGLFAATNRTSDYLQADEDWWQAAYNGGQGAIYIGQPEFDESSRTFGVVMAVPLYDEDGFVLGILRSTYRLTLLESLLALTPVGETGQVELYLPDGLEFEPGQAELKEADFNLDLLSQPQAVEQGYLDVVDEGISSLVSQAPVVDITNTPVIANLGWTIVVQQDRQEALAAVDTQNRNALLIALVVAGLAVMAAVGLAQYLINPIVQLTKVAEQVAGGQLSTQAEIKTGDEVGRLAAGFNMMTGRLRDTISSLEDRVADRTRQLETVVEVGQRLSGILDLSDLMREVVTLTKETFNYYHVHVYLREEDLLVMAEGYGQAGVEMKRQGHSISLAAEQSLVARAVRDRQIITVEDVRDNPNWLPNPLLPDTRSEMAVPIQLSGEIAGVLDVQSEHVGGLTTEDEAAMQALAGQIATALQNARLFTETQQALYQAQESQRLYTGQAWEKVSADRDTTDFEVSRSALPPLQETPTPEATTALQQGQTVDFRLPVSDIAVESGQHPPKIPRALATPLKLRDQIIGVLGLQDENSERLWTEDEVALIEAVSEQMSLALESARLFEETGRRANRERIIADMTQQVWASDELEEVMKTAVEQLGAKLEATKVVIRLGTEDQLLSVAPAITKDRGRLERQINEDNS